MRCFGGWGEVPKHRWPSSCGEPWSRTKQNDLLHRLFCVALVLHRVDPHLGTMVGASGNCQVEAVEAFLALSKIPRGTRPYRSLNFRQKLVVIGIVLLEHADVAFSAGNIDALACRVVIQIVRVLDSRKRSHQAARVCVKYG